MENIIIKLISIFAAAGYSTIAAAAIGAAAGYLGSLMIIRKMALVGDALSHVALPGLALGIIFHFNPIIGAMAFLVLATLGVWYLEQKSATSTETFIGIFFTASLALGILMTNEVELLEALFGDISRVNLDNAVIAVAISVVAILITHQISKKLLLGTMSKDLAKSAGVNVAQTDLIFLLLVAVVVALGINVAGTLLTGALVVIPAASAKNISQNFKTYSSLSLVFGLISAVAGILIAQTLSLPPGPVIVLSGTAIFAITFLTRVK